MLQEVVVNIFLKLLLIMIAETVVSLAFMWFVFGLWPKSWLAWLGIGLVSHQLAQYRIKLVFGNMREMFDEVTSRIGRVDAKMRQIEAGLRGTGRMH